MDKPKIEFSRGDFYKYDNQRFVDEVKQAKNSGHGNFPRFNIQQNNPEEN